MAPRAAPRSGCHGRPALPCLSPQTDKTIWLVQMGPQINGLLLRAANRSSGRVSTLAALPCPSLFVTTDRQTPLLLSSDWSKRGHKSTGCCCGPPAGPVGGCLPCPCLALFVTTDRQTPLLLSYDWSKWGHKSTGCCCEPPAGPVGECLP
jgi:hypothetical protein